MKKTISPCYKCEDRVLGCHGVCERYQAYAGIVAENRAERLDHIKHSEKLISTRRERERNKFKGEK